jgi:C1q domain
MSKVKIQGNASGTGIFTVAAPATNTDRTLTLPDTQGNIVVADSNNRVGLGTTIFPATDASLVTSSGIKMNITNPGQRRIYALGQTTQDYTLNLTGGAAVLFDRISGSDELAFETHYTGYHHREQMRITKEGYVKMPYQPAFYAYNGAAQNPGSVYTVQFTIAALNNGGHYNTSNYRFTAPIAGKYVFTFSGMSNGSYNRFGLFVNNTLYSDQRFSANQGYENFGATWIISLSTNDYVEIKNDLNSGGQGDIHGDYRNFGGYLIG